MRQTTHSTFLEIAQISFIRFFTCLLVIIFTSNAYSQTTFTESASAWGIALTGNKDGGFSFADFDNDGDMDLMVNAGNYGSGNGKSYLYRNDGTSFTDVTSSLAPALHTNNLERQAAWGDINNDGYLDFMRTTGGSGSSRIEVYLQDPATGKFGRGSGGSTTPISIGSTSGDDCRVYNGLNPEGAGLIDFDGDGDLDIYFDNHNYGVDLARNNYINHTTSAVVNPGYGSMFTQATAGTGTVLGLSQSATDGDYATSADVDDDGWVDLLIRKRNENDFFLNQGGTFSNGQNIAQASNSNKGGVALFDLDNDGDFDAVWTDNDGNYIHKNYGGTYAKLGGKLSIQSNTDIDGVDGADIDNDGDVDLIFSGNSKTYVFVNQLNSPLPGPYTGSAFHFILDSTFNVASNNSGNGEGISFVDIDNDGDMDFYENKHGSANKLWINNLYTTSTPALSKEHIVVHGVLNDTALMQSGAERYAIGANIVIKDCDGNVLSGIRNINGGSGHGTQNPMEVHFGLPHGLNSLYYVEVSFPKYATSSDTTRSIVHRCVNPAYEGSDIYIRSNDGSPLTSCQDYDFDLDTVPNAYDIDDDDDGIMDITEIFDVATTDFSGLDTILYDNAGNGIDPTGDEDKDGLPNYIDAQDTNFTNVDCVDANADGICDAVSSLFDKDLDGIPNFNDLDSDNDGIPDIVEANGTDADGDGVIDVHSDIDGDGLFDALDVDDTDGLTGSAPCTGLPGCLWTSSTSLHFDTDANGTNDWDGNTDNDELMDYKDLDSDNDGIQDIIEVGGYDIDGNGYVDSFNLTLRVFSGTSDTDNDGWANQFDGDTDQDGVQDHTNQLVNSSFATDLNQDTDRDGIPDFRDTDSDNDLIPDVVEALGADKNGDGRADYVGNAGWDNDNDGWQLYYDGDLNNDGNSTNIANALIKDSLGYAATDMDGDGIPNHLDIDSDNDGILDRIEIQIGDNKTLGTTTAPSGTDADGDGFDDLVDPNNADGPITNSTPNGTPFATTGSPNGSGDPIHIGDQDDFDNDGIPNFRDLDSDNDGILDILESVSSATPPFTSGNFPSGFDNPATTDVDVNVGPMGNGDGLLDVWDNNTGGISSSNGKTAYDDSDDSDGIPDFLDYNSDGDVDAYGNEFWDYMEHFDFDADAFSNDDLERMASMYSPINGGVAASNYTNSLDSDSDGFPNWFDDGETDGIPNFLDPTSSYYSDADGDGLVDILDADQNGSTPFAYLSYDIIDGTVLPYPVNVGNSGDPDFRDVLTAIYLPVEYVSFDLEKKSNDALVKWQTASEENNAYFQVLRSYDGKAFEAIATIPGKGGNFIAEYELVDSQIDPTTSHTYYKIKQVDYDGKSSLTETRVLEWDQVNKTTLYPNPASTTLKITNTDVIETIKVINVSGQIVLENATNKRSTVLDISKLRSGFYWIETTTKNGSERNQIMVYK